MTAEGRCGQQLSLAFGSISHFCITVVSGSHALAMWNTAVRDRTFSPATATATLPHATSAAIHPVERRLVHKRREENVLLSSLARVDDAEFLVGVSIPHDNRSLNGLRAGPSDLLIPIVEAGRQGGIALCHAYMGVEPGHAFILNSMQLDILAPYHDLDPRGQTQAKGFFSDAKYTPAGALRSVRAEGQFMVDGIHVCNQSSDWTIQPSDRYARLREVARVRAKRASAADGVAPHEDGALQTLRLESSFATPVLAETLSVHDHGRVYEGTLLVDQDNPFFFDHPNDHVPGMLVLQGLRELGTFIAARHRLDGDHGLRFTRMQLSCSSFAELDQRVAIVGQPRRIVGKAGQTELHVDLEARQGRNIAATGSMQFT